MLIGLGTIRASAQALEPRFYCNAPKNLNFLLGGYVFSSGGLSVDPSLPLEDAELDIHSVFAAYARTLDLFGKTAKFDISVPYSYLSGSGVYDGTYVERTTEGFGDPMFRFSYNFYGAPALSLEEFREYKQDLVLGATLKTIVPFGQYEKDKVVNIGQNRWAITPELGASQHIGRILLEASAAATLYTDNNEFNGQTKEQDPLYSIQSHLVYVFKNKVWIALDATWYAGGQTTVNDVERDDRIASSRFGGTLSIPINKHNSVKLYGSSGIQTRTGTDFDIFGIAWQYRWGGGI